MTARTPTKLHDPRGVRSKRQKDPANVWPASPQGSRGAQRSSARARPSESLAPEGAAAPYYVLQELAEAAGLEERFISSDDVGMEPCTLAVDVILKQRLRRLEVVEAPVDRRVVARVVVHLLRVEEILKVSAANRLLHPHPHGGVEAQHALYHLDCGLAGGGQQLVPLGLRRRWALVEEGPRGACLRQPVELLLGGSAQDTYDLLDLV
mmetsp:Transcript_55002/g.147273  ORF Transcript_55002/g.147273 Transcript_55002/m.147273 type:complete len:208 (-) Transcript_55002:220-843(-)